MGIGATFGLKAAILILLCHFDLNISKEILNFLQIIPVYGSFAELSTPTSDAKPAAILLRITYSERVAVPKGSMLLINISEQSGNGKDNQSIQRRLKTGSPPYEVAITLPRSGKAQTWVFDVVLQSKVGHRFSKKEIVKSEALNDRNTIAVTLELN